MSGNSEYRIPSLDGLRGISIALVLLGHLAGTVGFPLSAETGNSWNMAPLGVRVFFVISGFLITGLLLDEVARKGRIHLSRFYFRRTLRIFPPYYVYIAVMAALGIAGWLDITGRDLAQTLTYTSNYNQDRSWYTGHSWSLSVEEQFYLLWPGVMILAGVRRGIWIAAAVVLLSPAIRLFEWNFVASAAGGVGHRFETVADAIAIGCVLAGVRSTLHGNPYYMRLLGSPLFFVVPVAALAASMLQDRPQIYFAVGMSVTNIAVALCIDWAVTFHEGRIGRVLNAAPLVFVGWISYSLYLWQQPFLNRGADSVLTAFPQNLGFAVAAALLSYFLVERPSLAWRKRLETRMFPKTAPDAAGRPIATEVVPAA
jgi:peptidoglycan/LPS O-acetylase OafA/YrhL